MKKERSDNSITRAILDLLEVGEPTNSEIAEHHYALMRQAQSNPWQAQFAVRGGKSLYLPLSRFGQRQLTVTGPAGEGPEWVGQRIEPIASDLLSWSACVQAGATVLTGLGPRAHLPLVGRLPEPTWVPEVGMSVDTELMTDQVLLVPKRLSAQINVSNQLLVQTGADFDRILIADLSRALSSVLDREVLYGIGGDEPLGILAHPNTLKLPYVAADPFWEYVVSAETAVMTANVDMVSFANIMGPPLAGYMRITPVLTGQGNLIWNEIRRPFASVQVTNTRFG